MGPFQATLMIKRYYLYRDDGMMLSTAYLTEEEAAHQVNITDVEPDLQPGKVPWFVAGAWENRDVVVVDGGQHEIRQRAYPPIGEQLDMLFHAMDRGEIPKATAFYETIKAIKDAVPVQKSEVVFDVAPMPEA